MIGKTISHYKIFAERVIPLVKKLGGVLPNMIRLAQRLTSRKYVSLQLQSHIFEEETNLSVIPATFSRGLSFLLGEK
jgi:hypothetical protein